LFTNIFIVIANLLKSKRNNKIVQITKNKYITKILRYTSFAFFKIVVVINILIEPKNCSLFFIVNRLFGKIS